MTSAWRKRERLARPLWCCPAQWKGAFEAGVLSVLGNARDRYPIHRVVGASAGALNAAVFAAGIRAG